MQNNKLQFFFRVTFPLFLIALTHSNAHAMDYGTPDSVWKIFLAGRFSAFVAGVIGLAGMGCFLTGGGGSQKGEKRLFIGCVCLLISAAMFFFRFRVWRGSYTGY